MVYALWRWDASTSSYTRLKARFKSLECEAFTGCTLTFDSAIPLSRGDNIVLTVYSGNTPSMTPVFTGRVVEVEDTSLGIHGVKAVDYYTLWLNGFTRLVNITSLSISGLIQNLVSDSFTCYYNGASDDGSGQATGVCLNGVAFYPTSCLSTSGAVTPCDVSIAADNTVVRIRELVRVLASSGYYVVPAVERVDVASTSRMVREYIGVVNEGLLNDPSYRYNRVKESGAVRFNWGGGYGTGSVYLYGWSSVKHYVVGGDGSVIVPATQSDYPRGDYLYEIRLDHVPDGRVRVFALDMTTDSDGNTVYKPAYELCEDVDFILDWRDGSTNPPYLLFTEDWKGAAVMITYDGKTYGSVRIGTDPPVKVMRVDGGDPDTYVSMLQEKAADIYNALTSGKNRVEAVNYAYGVNESGEKGFFWLTAADWMKRYSGSSSPISTVAPVVGLKVEFVSGSMSRVAMVKRWRLDLSMTPSIHVTGEHSEVASTIYDALNQLNVKAEMLVSMLDGGRWDKLGVDGAVGRTPL